MQVEFIVLDIVLAVQAVVVIGAIVFVLVSWKRAKENDKVNELVQSTLPKLDEILEGIRELVKTSRPAGEQLVDISKDLKKIAESTRETVTTVSDTVTDVSATVKRQISKADSIVTENLERIESISDSIAEKIMGPLAEISAVLKGGAVAIKYLRGGHTSTVAHGDGHDENGQDNVGIR
jgi:methyl-accepting chemotaxis protein